MHQTEAQIRDRRDALIFEVERLSADLATNEYFFSLNAAQRNLVQHELKLTKALSEALGQRILLWPKLERS